jgi:hypothetical protein
MPDDPFNIPCWSGRSDWYVKYLMRARGDCSVWACAPLAEDPRTASSNRIRNDAEFRRIVLFFGLRNPVREGFVPDILLHSIAANPDTLGFIRYASDGRTKSFIGTHANRPSGKVDSYYRCNGKHATRGIYGKDGQRCPSKFLKDGDSSRGINITHEGKNKLHCRNDSLRADGHRTRTRAVSVRIPNVRRRISQMVSASLTAADGNFLGVASGKFWSYTRLLNVSRCLMAAEELRGRFLSLMPRSKRNSRPTATRDD